MSGRPEKELLAQALKVIGDRNLVFVGLMGAGKSVIGRLVAQWLSIPFADSDHEIEKVSRMSIADLFEVYGEEEFRSLEARVIGRLLSTGPRVISTGGGAFMNSETRQLIVEDGLSIWLKADLDVLWDRVSRRDTRPLLRTADPKATLNALLEQRYPIYQEADITVVSRDAAKEVIGGEVIMAITSRADTEQQGTKE